MLCVYWVVLLSGIGSTYGGASLFSYVYTAHAYLHQDRLLLHVGVCHNDGDGDPIVVASFWLRRKSGSKHEHDKQP